MTKRIFMIGTGPSLIGQVEELKLLKDEVTFGCNRLPLWKELPFVPTFYGITEPYNADQIDRYDQITSVWNSARPMRYVVHPTEVKKDGWVWVEKEKDEGPLAMKLHGFTGLANGDKTPLKTGRTSPLTLAQIAARMGFRNFYFLGIDFWDKGYCFDVDADPGVTVSHRTITAVKESLKVAKAMVEVAGGSMTDCTPGGRMNKVLGYKPLKEVLA